MFEKLFSPGVIAPPIDPFNTKPSLFDIIVY